MTNPEIVRVSVVWHEQSVWDSEDFSNNLWPSRNCALRDEVRPHLSTASREPTFGTLSIRKMPLFS